MCCRLRRALGVSWRDGRDQDGLVQRGTRKGVAVVLPRISAMPVKRRRAMIERS
jgi:hypothetical protein